MIRKVKFSNFYSFKKTQEINFLAQKKKTFDYWQSKSGDQITKVAGFVGSNASGKTNVMRLFSFVAFFVSTSRKDENRPGYEVAYKTFFNNKNVSNFSIEFEKDNLIFFYNFAIKNNIVLSEKLVAKKIIKGAQKKEIFRRELNEVFSGEDFFDASAMTLLKNIRPDVSLIAYLKANYNIEIINTVFNYFLSFKYNVSERGEINNTSHQKEALRMYLDDKSLKDEAEKFICDFDLGLSGFELREEMELENNEKKTFIKINGLHNGKKNQVLAFNYESRGTKQLIYSLAGILYALKHNSVVIIDEIENGFHPEALNKLISYFIDENTDGHAQLIFSSHSLGFMNKLDMHQINLVEKNKTGESFSYCLNQVEGIRTDDNFLSKYMSGIYGAFPKIRV